MYMYENVRERSKVVVFFLHTWAVSSSVLFGSFLFVRPFVCKCFTFSTFSPEPQGQFQLNLAQSIIGWRELKFVKTEGLPLSKREIKISWTCVRILKKKSQKPFDKKSLNCAIFQNFKAFSFKDWACSSYFGQILNKKTTRFGFGLKKCRSRDDPIFIKHIFWSFCFPTMKCFRKVMQVFISFGL